MVMTIWRAVILAVCLGTLSLAALPALADQLPGDAGTITFSTEVLGGPSFGPPSFGVDGQLVSAGSGHPMLGAPAVTAATTGPVFFQLFGALPTLLGVGPTGALGFTVFNGGAPAFPFGGGAASQTYIFPHVLGDPVADGLASVVDGNLNFRTIAAGPIDPRFHEDGVALSFFASFLNLPAAGVPGYAAVSLTQELVVDSGLPIVVPPIVLATDGFGPLPDVKIGNGFAMIAPVGPGRFYVAGASISAPFSIPQGTSLTTHQHLTMVVDPLFFDALWEPAPLILPPGFEFPADVLMSFGTAVPELSSFALFALGAALLGLLPYLRRQKHGGLG